MPDLADTYTATASNAPTSYNATGLPLGLALNSTTGALTGTPTTNGQSTVTLTATNAAGTSAPFTLTVTVAPSAATSVINSATSASVVAGGSLSYLISATNSPVSYNISALPAGLTANGAQGLISGIPTVPGTYPVSLSANNLAGTGPVVVLTLTVSASGGTPTPTPTGSRLVNISTRGQVGTVDNVLIAGFVITGSTSKPVIIRGVGPALATYGVNGTLPDPQLKLQLQSDGSLVTQNDNWATAGTASTIIADSNRVGAFPLTSGSLDAVIYTTLAPGRYTATLSGNGTVNTGVGLVEVYDNTVTLDSTSPRLVNISTRGIVGTGDNVMIPGFVITSDQPKQVLLRCVGPTLANYGVSGTLADPVIALNDAKGNVIFQNDNWGSAGDSAPIISASNTVGAFQLTAGSKDSVLLVTLQPALYTVTVSGANNTSGVALVEVYEVGN